MSLRILAGERVIACSHMALVMAQPKTRESANFNIVVRRWGEDDYAAKYVPRDFEARAAKWIIVCARCANSGDATSGVPYKAFPLTAELNLR